MTLSAPALAEPDERRVQRAMSQLADLQEASNHWRKALTWSNGPLLGPALSAAAAEQRADRVSRAQRKVGELTKELEWYLEEGLKIRLNGFVWELAGAATYAALRDAGVNCLSPRVCRCCVRVFPPSRKRTAQFCPRCGDRGKRPPLPPAATWPVFGGEWRQVERVIYGPGVAPIPDDEPSSYRQPTREIVDWVRVERAECSCGRVFDDVREMSRRGRRRRTCRNCQPDRRGPHEYVAASGAPLHAVKLTLPAVGLSLPKRVTLPADADGVLRTEDAEVAEILNRMAELKRVGA